MIISLILFVSLYIIYHFFLIFSDNLKTETAVKFTAGNEITSSGVVVREEVIIDKDISNLNFINYFVKDGEKISKDSVIASSYESVEDINKEHIIKNINIEIETIKSSEVNDTGSNLIDGLLKQFEHMQMEVQKNINNYDIFNIYNLRLDMLKTLNKKDIIVGKNSQFNDRIIQLNTYKEEILSNMNKQSTPITSDTSGFFKSKIDGYEEIFTKESIKDLNDSNLLKYLKDEQNIPEQKKIGKIILNSKWNYVCLVDKSYIDKLSINKSVNVQFSSLGNKYISMNIDEIDDSYDDSIRLILSSDIISENILSLRKESAKISFGDKKGIKIPRIALRVDQGESFVYTYNGNIVSPKKIKIIYEEEGFILSDLVGDKSFVQVYDDIVVRGNIN
ncbi:MAG: hypothetical protein KFW09_02205 [Oscillospiraceae bacterium]|nr:hypothetical protein [Oscillospiraceae bacterium]